MTKIHDQGKRWDFFSEWLFFPINMGFTGMQGNVSEMTSEQGTAVGGIFN